MATITGLTAARMLAIEGASVVSGAVVAGNLILTKHDGTTINTGSVIGPTGATGATGPTATLSGTYAARPAASAGLNGQIYFATDKMMSWMCIAAAWVLIHVYAPEVAVLPTVPVDQQECIFIADAANGVKWHLRYRAASGNASKWECIGGDPLASQTVTVDTTSSPTYVLPGTPVSVVTPLTGYYICEQRGGMYHSVAGHYIGADFHIAGVGVGIPINRHTPSAVWGFTILEQRAAIWRLALTAGQTVDQRFVTSSGAGNLGSKYLSIMPVRVG